jgi:RHS repeat-associated protein
MKPHATVALLAALIAFVTVPAPAQAQTIGSHYSEQGKLIRAGEAVGTLGADLFGDKINLYTGTVEFIQTDVSLPGNNALPVSVGRRLATGGEALAGGIGAAFGDWELEIPHLHGVFAESTGWQTLNGGVSRCTGFSVAPTVSGSGGGSSWAGDEYWHGHFIYVPGAGSQEILIKSPVNTNVPSDGSNTWPLVTKNHWALRCLSTMKRGAGQGFIAVSPDGTQYQFDWMVSRPYRSASKSSRLPDPGLASGGAQGAALAGPGGALNQTVTGPSGGWELPNLVVGGLLKRSEVWIMPTRVTDRYGNSVEYTYSSTEPWKVQTIVGKARLGAPALDERKITFTYQTGTQRIQSITDGNRTWNYSYRSTIAGTMLDRVTLPDNSFWEFKADRLNAGAFLYLGSPTCDDDGGLNTVTETGTMKHPSGATGSFSILATTHGKSFVERICRTDVDFNTSAYFPRFFAHKSLINKTITGPGLPSMGWNYSYSPATDSSSWNNCTGNCPDTKTVSVTDPRGYVTRYTFGNRHMATEGQLQKVEAGWNATTGTALRTTSTHYRDVAAGPYPNPAGTSTQRRGNGDFASRYTPDDQRVIRQQDVDFTWQASGFDAKARPATVVRSSQGNSRTETTVYYDHLAKWVLGQVETVTESGGKVMVLNEYDKPGTGNLLSTSKFGLLEQRFTYHPDGTLWTRADGLTQTTTFSNYARGLAQNVLYADGKTESATVDNMGLIRSVTDANSFTTKYDYDLIGRLKTITRPTGDTVAWADTSLVFEPVASDEYGLGTAGHWRQTVTTGNAKTITYFDGLWRPRVTRTFDATSASTEANTAKTVLRNFDSDNRKVFESYPARTVASITATPPGTTTTYDGLGRPNKILADSELGVLTTTIDYLSGFKKSVSNPRRYVTTTGYQTFDEPSESAIASIAAPETLSVNISRDKFGKPTSITRSGTQGGTVSATRSYVYDNYERLCKTVEPETGATIQAYDAANNTIWRASGLTLTSLVCDRASVPDASKVSYAYTDKRNRLNGTGFGDGSAAIGRAYTPDGLISSVVSGTSTWTYEYNKRRLLTQEGLSNGASYTIGWGYNPNGHTSQLTYPDGAVVSYIPNALGEATQVSGYTLPNTVSYHPNGRVAGYTLANGTVHTQTQNTRGLPLRSADAGVMADLYSYDYNGNVTAITDQQEGISSRGMGYDGLDRLTVANAPNVWGSGSYSYDALDNIRSSVVGGRNSIHIYNPSTNRLDTINTNGVFAGYAYDNQGNITGRGTQGYYFDQGNRMQLANGIANYTYDGWGRRTTIVDGSGNRVQVYDQAGQLLYGTRQQGATTVATRYVYLAGKAIAETDNAIGTTYLFTDALGSPVARVGTGPATVGYSCPSGWTLSGTTCSQGTTTTIAATLAGYNCPAGYTLSGSTCSQTTATSTAATVSYSCPAGWSLSGTTCTTSTSNPATPVYACPAGWSLSGTTCTTSTSNPATPVYACPAGWNLSGSTCTSSTSNPATPVYTCPAGFTLSGTTCTGTSTAAATSTLNCNGFGSLTAYATSPTGYKCTTQNLLVSDYAPPDDPYVQCQSIAASMGLPLVASPLISNSKIMQCVMGPLKVYSCPSGGSLSGSNCISTVTQAASIGSYTCASGTLSGSNCISTLAQAASIGSYTCSSGTLSGSSCISTGTQAASVGSYTCAAGTLSGSSCITGSSTAATPNYSCPAGTTLSGTNCNGTTTASTPGTPVYSCPAGYNLSGSSCTVQGTATAAATAAWTCPNGGTLSGISCVGAMWRTRYEAYGNTAAGTIPNGIGFTGHVNDVDTGLVYMQQRYYDPMAGRFMSLDPVVTDANTGRSFGRYHYANNSPYGFTDPDGRDPDRSGSAFQEALATCQRDTGTDCGHRGSNSGRATAVRVGTAAGFLFGTALAGGCTLGSGGACILVGLAIVGGGAATGAVVANTAFDFFDWMNGVVYSSAAANSGGAKPPANVEPISNPPQNPPIPEGWEQKPGRVPGSTVHFPPGTDPSKGENIRVMPPGSSPVTGLENGYWVWVNGGRQPMDPSTGKPGRGRGDTHVPLPKP